mmetsp:Transcript_14803/g.40902  ORF Transcript_14803/g.40902 Transcript_14803/m.40902 type:complete len:611 (-) Transcript_14803:1830-3662(-)
MTDKKDAIINPHNPDFITKKPWYLGDNTDEPTLDHQTAPTLNKKTPLSLQASEALVSQQRATAAHQDKFAKGQWVEALKKNKMPYRICQILAVNSRQTEFDLKYEDGTIERRVKFLSKRNSNNSRYRPRIRKTQRGTRSGSATGQSTLTEGMTETYDSKRDAYHGYDNESHNTKLAARFQEREAIRKRFRDQLKTKSDGNEDDNDNNNNNGDDDDNNADDGDDEYVQRDEDDKVITTRLARQGGVGGAQMKVTARNLRIREDTAKYLRNLDPNSAYYDPKSRSMRDNPNPEIAAEESQFAGDNFARISGDAVQLADTQLFAWDAEKKGVGEVHPQANPSQVELLKKQYRTKATDLKLEQKKAVLDKYGGEEHLDGTGGLASAARNNDDTNATTGKPSAKNLRFGASTREERYNPSGTTVGNSSHKPTRQAIPSKYEEDVYMNGHSTVWGSYFHKGAFQWGYEDDHSLIKMSYCTGETGRQANDEAHELQYGTGQAGSAELAQARKMLTANKGTSAKASAASAMSNRSKLYGEADAHQVLDPEKLKAAQERAQQEEEDNKSDRKRKYNSLKTAEKTELTEEDMEAYRLTKNRSEDPMAAAAAGGELLDYKK